MDSAFRTAFEYIHSFDDPYLAALRDKGKPTWGIENTRALLHDLGDPHLAYPTIHIAGTKGKGSTAAYAAQGLMEAGYKTGLYISPHLQDWRERIQINREPISGDALLALTEGLRRFVARYPTLSAFEVTTAIALWHFAREGCEAAVIEVGLGGRLDATSVVEPSVSVITHISYDHTQLLGNTLTEIAGEKAAIIKSSIPAVSAHQDVEAMRVIEDRARDQGSSLKVVDQDWQYSITHMDWQGTNFRLSDGTDSWDAKTRLLGTFQPANATLAAAALRQANDRGLNVPMQAVLRGIERTKWPGRLEVVQTEPRVVIDSAHNTDSMQKLMESLEALNAGEKPAVIFGCMADKDVDGLISIVLSFAASIVYTKVDNPRAADPEDLRARSLNLGILSPEKIEVAPTVAEALTLALGHLSLNDTLCACGSLAIAGEARTAITIAATVVEGSIDD